jgi:hypothetical protein
MTAATEALSAAPRTEYAAKGRADLDRRLVRLSPAERDAFWKAVGSAYVARRRTAPQSEEIRGASPRPAPSPLLTETC